MNGFNALGWWGKNRVLSYVGILNRGGGIILSLSLHGFHHGAVAKLNLVTRLCVLRLCVTIMIILVFFGQGKRGKFLSLP